ncbi:hypothetical protein MMC16_005786 [Acarospora aff. strigata]|nr:hypothetical protein [Acarospora aff. strigata]
MLPPTKRRKKSSSAVEEITFDPGAREEYLTGFHKRKVQRIKHAQEEAAKKERQERVLERKRVSRGFVIIAKPFVDLEALQMRDERKADLERHVETVNAMLREADGGVSESDGEQSGSEKEEWNGLSEPPPVDHEAEYIDEDRYTTVTVEAMDVSKEGLHRVRQEEEEENNAAQKSRSEQHVADGAGGDVTNKVPTGKRTWTKENPTGHSKKKKKKFRYESKGERKVTRHKERSGNKAKARARKE